MLIEVPFYCEILNCPCKKLECVFYRTKRKPTKEDKQKYAAADIPLGRYITGSWCIIYKKPVPTTYKVIEK
jgi:hypothetical protein